MTNLTIEAKDLQIGETVHYLSPLAGRKCQAAIVTNVNTDDTVCLHVFDHRGHTTWVDGVPDGPANGWEGFTPGTWHHLH